MATQTAEDITKNPPRLTVQSNPLAYPCQSTSTDMVNRRCETQAAQLLERLDTVAKYRLSVAKPTSHHPVNQPWRNHTVNYPQALYEVNTTRRPPTPAELEAITLMHRDLVEQADTIETK